jgi:parvulin-like peptidyl-prolyl isomerase
VNHRRLGLVAGALALVLVATACSEVRPDAATVNGVSIPRNEFEDQLQAYVDNDEYQAYVASTDGATVVGPGGQGTITMQFTDNRLTLAILYELVRQAVDERGLTITPEIRAQAETAARGEFAPAGPSADAVWAEFPGWFQEQAVENTANLIALRESLGAGSLDDAALQAIFEDNPQQFALMCARHIIVGSEEEAAQIRAQLDDGADFAEVAAASGTDGSAASGGMLYTEGQPCPAASGFVSDFVVGATSVPTGEIAGPFETEFGWHVTRVDSLEQPTFEQAKESVRAFAAQSAGTALRDLIAEGARGDITVDPKYGSWDAETLSVIAPALTTATTTPATTAG